VAARCGYTVTDDVTKRTVLLLRLRHLIDSPIQGLKEDKSLLAEECLVVGFTGICDNPIWLEQSEALQLIETAEPVADPPSVGLVRSGLRDLLEHGRFSGGIGLNCKVAIARFSPISSPCQSNY